MMFRVKKPVTIPAPESVTIGGKTFTITLDAAQTVGQGKDGLCDCVSESICINPLLPTAWKSSTLIHEIFEAVNIIWLSESLHHDDIDRLGEAFYQALTSLGIEIDWTR